MVKRAELMQTMYSKRTLVYLAIYLEHGESERERDLSIAGMYIERANVLTRYIYATCCFDSLRHLCVFCSTVAAIKYGLTEEHNLHKVGPGDLMSQLIQFMQTFVTDADEGADREGATAEAQSRGKNKDLGGWVSQEESVASTRRRGPQPTGEPTNQRNKSGGDADEAAAEEMREKLRKLASSKSCMHRPYQILGIDMAKYIDGAEVTGFGGSILGLFWVYSALRLRPGVLCCGLSLLCAALAHALLHVLVCLAQTRTRLVTWTLPRHCMGSITPSTPTHSPPQPLVVSSSALLCSAQQDTVTLVPRSPPSPLAGPLSRFANVVLVCARSVRRGFRVS